MDSRIPVVKINDKSVSIVTVFVVIKILWVGGVPPPTRKLILLILWRLIKLGFALHLLAA